MAKVDGDTAYVIDLFSVDHLPALIGRIPSTTSYVIAMLNSDHADKDRCVDLFTSHGIPIDKINCVERKQKIPAFYQAKLLLDGNNTSELVLISSENLSNFWKCLCRLLLTPCYKYSIEFLKQRDDWPLISDIGIEAQIREFLKTEREHGEVKILKSAMIPDDMFYHGFSCRTGGLSTVPGMSSLNLGMSNAKRDPAVVIFENRRRLADAAGFNAEEFYFVRAVHGSDVRVIGQEEPEGGYDAIITNRKNVTVAAPGADCVTVLFADPVAGACAALHSGWKGTVKRACIEVLKKMKENFGTEPKNVFVALGPSIGTCCFEFGADQTEQFRSITPESVIIRSGYPKPFINLHLCIRVLLEQNGVKASNIDDYSATQCTYCNPDKFFSFRRDGIPFGNQICFIGIR